MRNLLLNQQFRGEAHFRTVDGYVPYSGGGLIFDVLYLRILGVQPLWYLRKGTSYDQAVKQLLEDGIYADEHAAYEFNGHQYASECEWMGPRKMRFEREFVEAVWLGYEKSKLSKQDRLEILHKLAPNAELWLEPPEATRHKPCS